MQLRSACKQMHILRAYRSANMALDTVMFVFMETAADIAMCRPNIIDDKGNVRDRNAIVPKAAYLCTAL